MPDEPDSPLATATTDELFDELVRRYDAVVLLTERPTPDDRNLLNIRSSGGLSRVVGMIVRGRLAVMQDCRRSDPDRGNN